MAKPALISTGTPAPLSRFVGRKEALSDIHKHFSQGSRLVTVWGPAGMGKTRLAIEHGRARTTGGEVVLFVGLGEVPDLLLTFAKVALSCGVAPSGQGHAEMSDLAGRALAAAGPLLLILDNLEHLLPELATAILEWLSRAPLARVLATSRERTRIPGEAAIELLPLSLPAEAPSESHGESEAVELFLARVNEQRPDGPEDAVQPEKIADLVRALEGIPLAIELAAARFDVLGAKGLSSRLGQRLDLLSRGRISGAGRAMSKASGRTATLRGAIEWSWGLLPDDERVALARCSVFPSSFTLDAAAAVLHGLPAEPHDLVQSLRDKSMLRLVPSLDRARPSRFDLYEAVRQLASEKLAQMPGEAALATKLHADAFLEQGEVLLERFTKTGEVDALVEIAAELPHFFAIVGRATNPVAALRALVVMDPAVATRGATGAHAEQLDRAVRAAEQGNPPALLLGRALGARGRAEMLRGKPEEAGRDLERALSLAVASGDRGLEGELLTDLGVLAHRAGNLSRAQSLYEKALSVDNASGGSRTQGRVLGNLGALHQDEQRTEEAIFHYEKALSILATNGDKRLWGIASTNLGTLEQEQGALRAAKQRFEHARVLLSEAGDVRLHGITLTNLGLLHHEEGRLEDARFFHEQALQKLAVAGDKYSEGLAFARLGAALGGLGLLDEARVALHRAERAVPESSELVLGVADLSHAFVELTLARRGFEERRAEAATSHLAKARTRMDRGREKFAQKSDDVRALLRILERGISAVTGSRPAGPSVGSGGQAAPERALLLAPEGRWLKTPGGKWQDLRKRALGRRLLLKLVERQREAPGAGVSLDELREAGWPGERMTAASAANRIYVALHQLRGLGLVDQMVRTQDGYLLDPNVPVYHVAIEPVEEEDG